MTSRSVLLARNALYPSQNSAAFSRSFGSFSGRLLGLESMSSASGSYLKMTVQPTVLPEFPISLSSSSMISLMGMAAMHPSPTVS